MNLILLFEEDFIKQNRDAVPNRAALYDRRVEHISKVLGAKTGDNLTVGLLNNKIGTGKIIKINNSFVELEVTLNDDPPLPLPLTLIMALPRPKMLRRILQSSASLGIKNIYLINSWRVEKSFWSSPLLEPDNLKNELILGLEQAKDTIMPQIHLKRLFKSFVLEELPQFFQPDNCFEQNNKAVPKNHKLIPIGITAHPKSFIPCPAKVNNHVVLAMGPEGGFIDIEIETLEKIGFTTVNLGERILRLETAVPFIAAKLF